MPPGWAKQKLAKIHSPTSNISTHQIRIHVFKIGGREDSPRENVVAEAGSEALNLILQFLKHVYRGSIRNMTIGPGRMFAGRGPRVIEEARLRQQNEGTIGVLSASHGLF